MELILMRIVHTKYIQLLFMASDQPLFDPKQINLPFTIAIIKPDTVLNPTLLQELIKKIEQSPSLTIKNMFQRELFRQQIVNLYYKHEHKPYFEEIVKYMLSGECCVMVLVAKEGCTNDPIAEWKKIIGSMNPEQAKKSNPESWRGKYGKSIVKNQFHGSDSLTQANKERKIFQFKVPQRPPQFHFDPYKLTLTSIKQFLHPPNLQHSQITERMDILALYGPIVNWHSIQQCFCTKCIPVAREHCMKVKNVTKKKVLKMLKQQDVKQIFQQLCEECRAHVGSYTHLLGGREMQHILTDSQITGLIAETNKKQLIQMLTIEKGSTAKVMIEKIPIKQPKEIAYTMELFQLLLKEIQCDYYERYDFRELQNLLLEDRRIRIVYWVSKITSKSVDRFPSVTTLDNTLTVEQLKDPKSPFYTLTRKLPLPILVKPEFLKNVPLNFPPSIIDKPKLFPMEQNLKVEKLMNRNLTKVITVGVKSQGKKEAVTLLRQYNEGRHGDWDNYAILKGNSLKGQVGGRFMQKYMKQSQ